MDWKLELVVVPVSDVDRAKAFYIDRAGFRLDVDHSAGEDFRVVQLTPPGSACSIALMRNLEGAGSAQGLQLVVSDVDRGASTSSRSVASTRGSRFTSTCETGAQRPGLDPNRSAYNSFLAFSDPDGNRWMVQERPAAPASRLITQQVRRPKVASMPRTSPSSSVSTAGSDVAEAGELVAQESRLVAAELEEQRTSVAQEPRTLADDTPEDVGAVGAAVVGRAGARR